MVESTTMNIAELFEAVKEGAEMIDNIYDGENVIPEEAGIVSVPKHTLLDKQEIEESKDNFALAQSDCDDKVQTTTLNVAQIKL